MGIDMHYLCVVFLHIKEGPEYNETPSKHIIA